MLPSGVVADPALAFVALVLVIVFKLSLFAVGGPSTLVLGLVVVEGYTTSLRVVVVAGLLVS